MIDYLVLGLVGYLLGAIPFGVIAGWAAGGVDVRRLGSGNTGTTNVLRTVGRPAAAVVLLLDMGKGVLAVFLARVFTDAPGVEAAAGLLALAGHNWPVFIGFRGGKGTATGWGGLLLLSPVSGLVALLVAAPVIVVTRYASMASLVGVTSGVAVLVVLSLTGHAQMEYVWFGAIGGLFVVARHKENIQRLLRGEERRLGQTEETGRPLPKATRRKGLRWSRSA